MLRHLADLLAPPGCAACDSSVRQEVFCSACQQLLVRQLRASAGTATLSGVPLLVAGPYAPPLSQAVQRLKYGDRSDLAPRLSSLWAPRLSTYLSAHPMPLVTAVPLHAKKLAARGYNQSALLARALARIVKGRHAPFLLAKTRESPAQATLDRQARLNNLHGTFEIRQTPARGTPVIIVDDVVTTGSTLHICLDLLQEAGCIPVLACALAQSEANRRGPQYDDTLR